VLEAQTVSLYAISSSSCHNLPAALESKGLRVAQEGALAIIVADDYVHQDIAALNREYIAIRRPWMLVKPTGPDFWAGPLFRPGENACWACLRHRLVENRWKEQILWRQGRAVPVSSKPVSAHDLGIFWLFVAQLAAEWLLEGRSIVDGSILNVNIAKSRAEPNSVIRRAECEICRNLGRPRLWAQHPGRPTLSTILNTHCTPITGFLSGLTEYAGAAWRPVHVIAAQCVLPLDARAPLLGLPPEITVGRGLSIDEAWLTCLAEGCERYSTFYQGHERILRDPFSAVADAAVHPASLLHISERQYREAGLRSTADEDSAVPPPFDEVAPIDWVEVQSWTHSRTRLVPAAYCYLRHYEPDHPFCIADSNGCAAGADFESAVERGLHELIERDAAALWWYNQIQRPGIVFDVLEDPFLRNAPALFARNGYQVWLIDLTTDWGLPVIAALACNHVGRSITYAFGAGSHLETSAKSALTELIQTCLSYDQRPANDARATWRRNATLSDYPFLIRSGIQTPQRSQISLGALLERAAELGLEVLVADLTRPEVSVPVARVIVPGLRPLKRRLAPGRLYDVPVKLGWRSAPLPEELMNPTPCL
jgi:bacteriocin biosynthesis cyclodehydratase domain-containing protein